MDIFDMLFLFCFVFGEGERERWYRYNREVFEDDEHPPGVAFSVRPLSGASG
ncbi:hypothetical protein J0S82_000832 [Galemys pyrenaicus]|uniref:Uncharacterized protein n=1 Tax=Galemys pyrenaicus TaxID=202257 RepID=A0A8J6DCE7_GALPY|nr:hypothetical protein J0S82_000832 [Galemys pyrenaicus]